MNKLFNTLILISLINSFLFCMKRSSSHETEWDAKKICTNREREIFPLSPIHTRSIAYNSLILGLTKYNENELIKLFDEVKNKYIYNGMPYFPGQYTFEVLDKYHRILVNENRVPLIKIVGNEIILN